MRSAWIDEAAGTNNHPAAIAVFFVRRQACAALSFSGCDYSGSDEIFLRSEKGTSAMPSATLFLES
jgi:hypothetical protein